jgi:hypothetical protein
MYRWEHPKVYQTAITWYEANISCTAQGGNLITIDSEEKNIYLQGLISSLGFFNTNSLWIGYARQENTWAWVSGSQSRYTNWDGSSPLTDGTARCAAFHVGQSDHDVAPKGFWSDLDCLDRSSKGYICELPAGIGATTCVSCASKAYGCLLCPSGSYGDSGNASACTTCKAGSYASNPGAAQCDQCPPGTYMPPLTGATSSAQCVICPVGKYSNTGHSDSTSISACTACEAGSYASEFGASQCDLCAPGTYAHTGEIFLHTTAAYTGADMQMKRIALKGTAKP